jgi:beta-glucosidase
VVNPTRLEQPVDALRARGIEFSYAPGYQRLVETVDERLIADACAIAGDADAVVVFAGLTEMAESEAFDRPHMRLPANQNALIGRLATLHQPVIVVLFGGSPVEMPWAEQVQAILNMYLPGQAGGAAVVDLLLGDANPGGKLAETYPLHYEDVASAKWFPGEESRVEYRESIFVGYRYFDTAQQAVRFPFGHGLSYTRFSHTGLELSAPRLSANETLQVHLTVTNVGERVGAEVVQVYIRPANPTTFKAEHELKAFQKLTLQPGESQRISFTLDSGAFAHYDVARHAWTVESGGSYEIEVGASSRDIRLRGAIQVVGDAPARQGASDDALIEYRSLALNHGAISDAAFAALYGPTYRKEAPRRRRPYTINSTLSDIKGTLIGRILYRATMRQAVNVITDSDPERELAARQMVRRTIEDMPLRGLATSSGGAVTYGMMESFVALANGHLLRGALSLLRSLPPSKRSQS